MRTFTQTLQRLGILLLLFSMVLPADVHGRKPNPSLSEFERTSFAHRQMELLRELLHEQFAAFGICNFEKSPGPAGAFHFDPSPPPLGLVAIPAGSYIIRMDVQPQTVANALKPYGLVWHLLHEHEIPVCWAIQPGKEKDGLDFTYNGQDFRGGPFIVKAEYRSAEVNALIANWEAQGVVGVTTDFEITVPVERELNYSMNWTLNQNNGQIAKAYLDAAGIPSTAYDWTLPQDLDCCNDVFLMPHSEPEWQTHSQLFYWNDSEANGGCRGTIWAGCKAGSEVENIVNPGNPAERMNFLMLPPVAPATTPAVWSGDHDDGTLPPPYVYHFHDHPVMQFIGSTDGSQENGAEQIYLPSIGWRPTTMVGIVDADHPEVPSVSPGPAAKLAFGPAFGDSARGMVCYQAGHRLNKDDNPQSIASQRAFFNFSFMAAGEKAIHVTSNIPAEMDAGQAYTLSVNATGGSGNYYYEWSSTCPGTISNPYASSITFMAGAVLVPTECTVKVTVTDDCGTRVGFSNVKILVKPTPAPPVGVDDYEETQPGSAVTLNPLANDSDPNLDPLTLASLLGPTSTGNGIFVDNGNGQVTYTPDFDFVGVDQINYIVCDDTPAEEGGALCDTATIFITVDWIDGNGCFPNEFYGVLAEGYAASVLAENSISNAASALGEPLLVASSSAYYAKLDNNSDYLVIDLAYDVPAGDTIWLHIGSDDGNSSTLSVQGSLNGTAYGTGSDFYDLQSFTTAKDLNQSSPAEDVVAYVPSTGPVRKLRFTRAIDAGKPSINGVYYEVWDCLSSNPVVADDAAIVCEDHAIVIDVLANDSDPQDLPMTAAIATLPSHGTLGVQNDGTIKYQPATDYDGPDSFTYQACNGNGICLEATVSISVIDDGCPTGQAKQYGAIDESVADNFPSNTYSNNTGSHNWTSGWTEEGDDGTYGSGDIKASSGMVECAVDGPYAIYRQADLSNTVAAIFSFDVSGHSMNGDDVYVVEASNNGGASYLPLKFFNAGSPSYSSESFDLKAVFSSLSSNVRIRFRRTAGSGGEKFKFDNVQIQYQVVGCFGSCQLIPTYPPDAVDDFATTVINQPVTIDVQGNDIDPSALGLTTTLGFSNLPENGTVELVGQEIRYTPNHGFAGQDEFNYLICNIYGCDSALVTVDVLCADPTTGRAVQGMVFKDNDQSGSFGSGEQGVGNVRLRLFNDTNANGQLDAGESQLDSALTDSQGNYVFYLGNGNVFNSSSTIFYAIGATGEVKSDYPITYATGAPNGDYVKMSSGKYVILEFAETIPSGTNVTIYLASDKKAGEAIVSSSLDGVMFSNPIIWKASYSHDPGNPPPASEIVSFTYQVNATNGARFIKVERKKDNIYVDAARWKQATTTGGATTVSLTRSISSGSDDAEEEGPDGSNLGPGSMYLSSTDLEITQDLEAPSSGTQKIGLRFNSIDIPPGAAITSATLRFRAISADSPNSNSGAAAWTIHGEATDDAAAFVSQTNNISNRPLTAAWTVWNPTAWTAGTDYTSPHLTAVVQEIVSRPGWSEGNSMAFVISGTGSRSAASYNGNPAQAPVLDITYTTGNGIDNGHFILEVVPASLPANSLMTTASQQAAVAINPGSVDCANNFGMIDHLPPVANPDTVYVDAGTAVLIKATANDYDPEGTPLSLAILSNPANGTLSGISSGNFTYTPNGGFLGWETFPYAVCDQGTPSLCDSSTVTVIVTPFVNDAPEAQNDYDTTVVNHAIETNVLANDFDQEFGQLTASLPQGIGQPANGSVMVLANGSVEYTPNQGYTGNDTYQYVVCDPESPSLCDTATVFIHVKNQPPVAVNDAAETGLNQAVAIPAMDNDYEPDGHGIILVSAGSASNATGGFTVYGGSAILNNNGTPALTGDDFILYTPPSGFLGQDTFFYKIKDTGTPAGSDVAMVVVTVKPLVDLELGKTVDPDVAQVGQNVTFTLTLVNKGPSPATGISVSDKLTASYSHLSNSGGGAYDPASGIWYVPSLAVNQTVTLSITAEVVSAVSPKNIAQVVGCGQQDIDSTPDNDDGDQSEDDEASATPIIGEACTNGIDDDGDGLVDCLDPDCGGIPSVNLGPDLNNCGVVSRTLTAAVTGGTGPFTYTWSDGLGSGQTLTVSPTATTTYTVTVTSAYGCTATDQVVVSFGNALTATASADATICSGTSTNISAGVTGGDAPHTFAWSHGLGSGTAKSVSPLFSTTYTVTVTSSVGCTSTDQVTVSVNQTPVANAGPDVTICKNFNTTLAASATGGSAPFSYNWSNGLGSDASVTISPSSTRTYTVTVTSNNGCASTDQVTVTVQNCPENCGNGQDDDGNGLTDCEDPVCGPQVDLGTDISICLGYSTTLTATVNGGNGNLSYLWNNGLGSGQSKTVSPTATTTYSVTVTSQSGCSDVAQKTVTVVQCSEDCTNGLDDDGDGLVDCDDPDCAGVTAPVLADDVYSTCPGMPFSERVTYNDGNLQSPVFSIYADPAQGAVTIDETGKFYYTPFGMQCTTDIFLYQVCNPATGCCDQATVTLNFGDVTPPVLTNVPADLTINCDDAVPPAGLVTAFDQCPGLYIEYEETSDQHFVGACESYTITRTWTATDLCGNQAKDEQLINVLDQTKPEVFQVYTLANGKRVVAGISQNVTHDWKYVKLPVTFGQTPVVLTQVVTASEATAVNVQQRNMHTQGFEIRLREEEAADGKRKGERVAWLAIEPGAQSGNFSFQANTLGNVDNSLQLLEFPEAFDYPPLFFSALQTTNEQDPVVVRHNELTAQAVEFFLQEETSADAETNHPSETLGFLAMAQNGQVEDARGDVFGETGTLGLTNAWATVTLARQYTKPVVILGGLTNHEGHPVTVRVRNLTSNSFQARLEEWGYLDGNHSQENVSWIVVEGSIPGNGGYFCSGKASHLKPGINIFAIDNCDNLVAFGHEENTAVQNNGLMTTRSWMGIDDCGNTSLIVRYDTCAVAAVRVKAELYGALIGNANSMMRDELRSKEMIPVREPYSKLPGFPHVQDHTENYVTICHQPGTLDQQTMTIPQEALQDHLNHGDLVGACLVSGSALLPAGAQAATYRTIADGNWQDPSIWLGGVAPPSGAINNQSISIEHHVVYPPANMDLNSNSKIWITNGSLTLNVGWIKMQGAAKMWLSNATLTLATGSFEMWTGNDVVLDVKNSDVTVAGHFNNWTFKRKLENVCLNVGGDMLNYQTGIDTLINVNATVGGLFANQKGAKMHLSGCNIRSKGGNIENEASSIITGDNVILWVENGNVINNGTWTAPIAQYCISGTALNMGNIFPAVENCLGISAIFSVGGCTLDEVLVEPEITDQTITQEEIEGPGTIDPILLATTGGEALVDWMLVELRDPLDDKSILDYATVVLQRDGNIVNEDGDPVIIFPEIPEGEYYVAVRHRNHLPLMTNEPVFLTTNPAPLVDFTNLATPVRGGNVAGRINNGKRTMWGGDFNEDGKVIYQGPYNDVFQLFTRVLADENNTDNLANFIIEGYETQDMNLDGKVIYQGPNNDRASVLYYTVLASPANMALLANYIVLDFLP